MSGNRHVSYVTLCCPGDEVRVATLQVDLDRHHPGARLQVVVIGAGAPQFEGSLTPGDIGIRDGDALLLWLALPPGDLRRALAPRIVASMLSAGRPAVFLAADTHLLAPLPPPPPSGVAMMPTRFDLPPVDGRTPDASTIACGGRFDDGFLAAAPDAADILLRRAVREDMVYPLPGDAAWAHSWDMIAAELGVVDDALRGLCLSASNIDERIAGDDPSPDVISLRLPGFDPLRPWSLGPVAGDFPRVLPSEYPFVREALAAHAATMRDLAARHENGPGQLGDVTVDDAVRAAVRSDLRAEGDIAALIRGEDPGAALGQWLAQPAQGSTDLRINRYLLGLWVSSEYARVSFPNPLDDHAQHYLDWVCHFAGPLGVQGRFLPAPVVDVASITPTADTDPADWREGVNVVGFLRAGFGIGEATRLLEQALTDGGIPHSALSVSHGDIHDADDVADKRDAAGYDINLICVNADWLDTLSRRLGPRFLDGRYAIGTWWWESNKLPQALVQRLPLFDEIWAGSTFVADALRPYTDAPVCVFPLPIRVPDLGPLPPRADLGLPEGYLFMFSFDLNSTVERKNPEGLIKAFRSAFAPGEGAHLVIKTTNGQRHLDDLEWMRMLTADRSDIHIVDEFLPSAVRDAWAQSCDCYVSLHRSEGFGLTLAEAMAAGKPVIATRFSANLDFMNDDVGFLVDCSPWELHKQTGPYPEGTIWADPDIHQAARLMRQVFDQPEDARQVGARARMHIHETRGPEHLANFVRQRLGEIRMSDARPARYRGGARPAPIEDALEYDRQRRASRASGRMGRLVGRLIRPYTASADELDQRTLDALDDVADRLQHMERRLGRLESVTSRGLTANEAMIRLEAEERRRAITHLETRASTADDLVSE